MDCSTRRSPALILALLLVAIIGWFALPGLLENYGRERRWRVFGVRGECAMLISACKTYHAFAHVWPEAEFQEGILLNLTSPIEMPHTHRPPVLEGLKSQVDERGRIIDTWGSPYVIEFPEDSVLVYSFGPDVDSDEGHYEGDGCADGVHESMGAPEPWDDVRP